MVLLGDKAQVEARFGPFGDSANLDARWVHGLRRMYHRLRNSVSAGARWGHGLHQMYHRLRNHFGRSRLFS
jgi:hypothetical protein